MIATQIKTLARYNDWANRRLYAACLALPPGEAARARPSFFGSIVRTLNHLLVADRIWFGRIEGVDHGARALDEVLYPDLADLARARASFDAHIIAVLDPMDDARILAPLVYRTLAADRQEQPLHLILAHVFNHHAHHRGQVHQMLSEAGVAPPPLDLLYFLRDDTQRPR